MNNVPITISIIPRFEPEMFRLLVYFHFQIPITEPILKQNPHILMNNVSITVPVVARFEPEIFRLLVYFHFQTPTTEPFLKQNPYILMNNVSTTIKLEHRNPLFHDNATPYKLILANIIQKRHWKRHESFT